MSRLGFQRPGFIEKRVAFQRPGFIEKGVNFQRPGFIEGLFDDIELYELSTKQERSPLGWSTTIKNIRGAGDRQFKKHAFRFYRKYDDSYLSGLSLSSPGTLVLAGLVATAVGGVCLYLFS